MSRAVFNKNFDFEFIVEINRVISVEAIGNFWQAVYTRSAVVSSPLSSAYVFLFRFVSWRRRCLTVAGDFDTVAATRGLN